MSYSDPRTQRLYSRLWARVKNATDSSRRARALRALRRRFPEQVRVTAEVRRAVKKAWRERLRKKDPKRLKRYSRNTYLHLKARVMSHYSRTGNPQCNHPGCPVIDLDQLELDHVDNDWSKDVFPNGRRMGGTAIYRKLVREGFPSGYQPLCREHNVQKGPRPYAIRKGLHPVAAGLRFQAGQTRFELGAPPVPSTPEPTPALK